MKKIFFTILIILFLIFLYGKYIEPNNLTVKEYTIKSNNISNSFKELKIVHFSDLLYNGNQNILEKISNEINNLNADIILFTGDLFNSDNEYNEDDLNNLQNFLNNLNAEYYKYAVYGENDEKYLEKFKILFNNANFKILDNESDLLFYKDITPIKIIGYTNDTDINELLQSDVEYNYSIVITHKPDNIEKLSNYNIDTVIAGHSLGGIINIPYYGGMIKKDGAKTYINSHYEVNNSELFVSNGIGYKTFEFRLLNTPSISVYRFD